MLKKISVLCILLCGIIITSSSGAGSGTGIIIAKNGLNLRKAPSIGSKRIALVPYLELVVINGRSDEQETIDGTSDYWYNITYTRPDLEEFGPGEAVKGYVFGGYLLGGRGLSSSRLSDYKQMLSVFTTIHQQCLRSKPCTGNNSYMQGIVHFHYYLLDNDTPVFTKSMRIAKNKKALQAFLDFAYKNKKKNLLGSSFKGHYAFYKDMLYAYLKVYRVLLKEFGREQIISDFNLAREALRQKPDRDGLVPFYKNFMITHNIDLKANIMHRKRNFTAVGFWIRRIADGTDTILYKTAVKIVKENDPRFYAKYITGNGIAHEALKRFPKATLKKKYLLPAWWKDQVNRTVTILKRRQNFDYLDYYVELDGKRAWISAYHLFF